MAVLRRAPRAFIDGAGAGAIARAHREEDAPIPPGKRVLRWTTNHDETAYDAPPPVLFGSLDASLAAYASMVAYGATPLVYSGQEVGVTTNTPFIRREPIDWTANPDVSAWYAWVLGVRQQHPSLRTGSIADRSVGDTLMVTRTRGDERVAVIVNTSGDLRIADTPDSWAAPWTDLRTDQSVTLGGTQILQPHALRVLRQAAWPTYVIAGELQTEQGDPADWDAAESSLVMDRAGGVYTVTARNLEEGVSYAFEVVTDRAQPPAANTDPRVATNLRTVGDADGTVRITVDETSTNNTNGPVVWIESDALPLQAVGNFMDEAGGANDWNPADPAFAMTRLGNGRYVYDTVLASPGDYTFKSSFGAGWNDQVGTDGFSDDADALVFNTTAPGQRVRLFVDVREQHLDAWIAACDLDRNDDQRLDFMDTLAFLREVDGGSPAADRTGDGLVDTDDIYAFLTALANGCGQANP